MWTSAARSFFLAACVVWAAACASMAAPVTAAFKKFLRGGLRSMRFPFLASELDLQARLVHARRQGARGLAEGGGVEGQRRVIQVHAVERVVRVHLQLGRKPFRKHELLRQR